MTEVAEQLPDLGKRRDALMSRLTLFGAHVKRHLLVSGAARIAAEMVIACVLSLLLDRWLRLSLPMRVIFVIGGLAGLGYELRRWILPALWMQNDFVSMAAAIDRARGNRNGTSLAPRVATVLELPELLNRTAPPSRPMVERAVIAADESLRSVTFESNLDDRRYKFNTAAIAGILFVSLLLIVLNPHTFGLWTRRWFAGSNEPWPQRTYLDVIGLKDGKLIIPRGEPFTLRINAGKSEVPETISLRIREGKGPRTSVAMNKFAENDFRFDLPAVQLATTVEAEGGDDDTGEFMIEPVDRPRLKTLSLISQHPTEKQPQVHDFGGQDADLAFLPKTHLKLELQATAPIGEAKISGAPAEVKQVADDRFVIEWTHEKPVAMQIELTSAQAKLTSLPTPVTIGLKIDQPPRVSLSFTGVRQRISPMARIPLAILARDDYGVAQIDLASKAEFVDANKQPQTVEKSNPLFGPKHPADEQEIQQKAEFALTPMKLLPGTILSLSASATDERYESPQIGASRAATFRVVAAEELFREILLRQQGERAKFRKQIDEATKIKDALATLSNRETAAQLARQHRSIQREVLRIATSLADSVTEMDLNGLGTKEAYELMQKNVLAPLKQMDTDLMIPQRDALDNLANPSARLDEIAQRQDRIVTRMNQILKQMSQWDSFIDVLNQLNEIIRMQEGVKVGTEGLKSKQTEGIFDK